MKSSPGIKRLISEAIIKLPLASLMAQICGYSLWRRANVAGNIPVPTRPGTLYTIIGNVVASAMDLKCKY